MPEPLTLEQLTLETGPKLLAYLATLISAGAAVTLGLAGATGRPTWSVGSLATRAQTIAVLAGVIALVALALRAAAHAAVIAGSPVDVTLDTLRVVTIDSRWGGGWRWQVLAAAAVTLAAWRVRRPAGVPILALAVAAWCVATPALGHGASTLWQRAVHALHVGASGAWIGTVLVLAVCFGATRTDASLADVHTVVRRFSPWALATAALVGASGLILALTYLGGTAGFATPYGWWLVAKVVAVAALGACGYGNWQRSRADRPPSPALIRTEAAIAVLVLVLTTILTETEHN